MMIMNNNDTHDDCDDDDCEDDNDSVKVNANDGAVDKIYNCNCIDEDNCNDHNADAVFDVNDNCGIISENKDGTK
jgi:hypothetical protein